MKRFWAALGSMVSAFSGGGSSSRALIAVLCIGVISARARWPELRFDSTSLWLLVIAVLVILLPDIGDLINRITKIRKGDLEIELEARVDKLAERTEEIEEEVVSEPAEELPYEGMPEEMRSLLIGAGGNPRGALVSLAVEIEARLHQLAEQNRLEGAHRVRSPGRLMRELVQHGIVSPKVGDVFREFWDTRNKAVHSRAFEVSENGLFQLVDLGLRILRMLGYQAPPSSLSAS